MRRLAAALLWCACVTSKPEVTPRIVASSDDPERLLAAFQVTAEPSTPARLEKSQQGAKGDLREVYRKVAPATVIIRAGTSYGSGVIVDPRGFVITNHHVIAHAELVDLKAKVQVQRGALSPEGVMVLDEKPLSAWVLESDPLIDLAVLKLIDPPAGLPSVKISKRDPVPGEPVAALGHGAIGLLWAIKDGEVASVGKLATHLASLVGTDCVVESDGEASPACRSAGASVELERKRLEEKVPGLVVQSSCQISPGDSGGPLVNLGGELVGVNAFLKTDTRAGVATNFHVHVAEVRKFLETVPTEPQRRLPSPWELVLPGGVWADVDGDGRDDLYTSGTGPRTAFVVNASQQVIPPAFMTRLKPDAVLGQVGGQWIGWFDRDRDGTFDRVILGGTIAQAIEFDGRMPGRFLGAASLLDAALLTASPWRAIANELQTTVDASALPLPPDPMVGAKDFRPRDLDGDGKPELITARRGAGSVAFIDATGVGTLEASTVRLVRQLNRWWIYVGETRIYESVDFTTIERAWLRSGGLVPAPELRGADWRAVVLSSFTGWSRERVGQAFAAMNLYRPAAPPKLFPIFGTTRGKVNTLSAPNLPLSIVTAADTQATTIAFAFEGKPTAGWAQQGFPGAGFLWSSSNGQEWFQFDTDADGAIDTVLIRRGAMLEGRRISKEGAITAAPDLEQGRPIKPALMSDPSRAQRLRVLAAETFAPEQIEP